MQRLRTDDDYSQDILMALSVSDLSIPELSVLLGIDEYIIIYLVDRLRLQHVIDPVDANWNRYTDWHLANNK